MEKIIQIIAVRKVGIGCGDDIYGLGENGGLYVFVKGGWVNVRK